MFSLTHETLNGPYGPSRKFSILGDGNCAYYSMSFWFLVKIAMGEYELSDENFEKVKRAAEAIQNEYPEIKEELISIQNTKTFQDLQTKIAGTRSQDDFVKSIKTFAFVLKHIFMKEPSATMDEKRKYGNGGTTQFAILARDFGIPFELHEKVKGAPEYIESSDTSHKSLLSSWEKEGKFQTSPIHIIHTPEHFDVLLPMSYLAEDTFLQKLYPAVASTDSRDIDVSKLYQDYRTIRVTEQTSYEDLAEDVETAQNIQSNLNTYLTPPKQTENPEQPKNSEYNKELQETLDYQMASYLQAFYNEGKEENPKLERMALRNALNDLAEHEKCKDKITTLCGKIGYFKTPNQQKDQEKQSKNQENNPIFK